MHQVGEAFTPGRHVILRGLADEEEGRAIDAAHHLLSGEEWSRLYSDRPTHKDVVLLLHEWGHTAGLLHQEDSGMIMKPSHDVRQSAFSDFGKQVLTLMVEKRRAHRDQPLPERAQLLALFEKAPRESARTRKGHGCGTGCGPQAAPMTPTTEAQPAGQQPSGKGLSVAEIEKLAVDVDHIRQRIALPGGRKSPFGRRRSPSMWPRSGRRPIASPRGISAPRGSN